ncbi:MAG: hypothetical protein E7480_04980 [Ruminococcaceae bacterium]|nr:hypothetical protein [Oscillospiraceae bacterium]
MKAIILAGGMSTRLRPITCTIPKPMAKICGIPVMERIIELLKENGITECAVTLLYLSEKIKEHFGDGSKYGISIKYFEEKAPLGTAGGAKSCEGFTDDTVLIISGDAACEFDLKSVISFHKRQKADATIVTTQVEEPYEFGVVLSDEVGSVTGFIEKPSVQNAYSNIVNAGIYIMEPQCFELIDKTPFDFSKDLFPLIMKRNLKLCAYNAKGYWCDIGTTEKYLSCNIDAVTGKYPCKLDGASVTQGVTSKSKIPENVVVIPPCYIGENVQIGNNAVIGQHSIIEDNVQIGDNASIKKSIIGEHSRIGSFCEIRGSVICSSNILSEGVRAFEGSIIGDKCTIGKNAFIDKGVKIWPQKGIPSNCSVTQDIIWGNCKTSVFDDDGLCGKYDSIITPSVAANAGVAVASALQFGCIAVAGNSKEDEMLSAAFSAGVMSAGLNVLNLDICPENLWKFCITYYGCRAGAYFKRTNGKNIIFLCSENGIKINSELEKKIEVCFENSKTVSQKIGKKENAHSYHMLYSNALKNSALTDLNGITVQVHCPDTRLYQSITTALSALGCEIADDGISFFISPDGNELTCIDERGSFYSKEYTENLAILCDALNGNKKINIPITAPSIVKSVLKNTGADIITVEQSKDITNLNSYLAHCDAGFAIVCILTAKKLTKKPLYTLSKNLPSFHVLKTTVESSITPGAALDIFRHHGYDNTTTDSGIRINDPKGIVTVSPSKEGKKFILKVESKDTETAKELCADISDLLKTKEQ